MGELVPFRPARRRPALPREWTRYVRPRPFTAEQIRLTIWSGLLLGLLAFQLMRYAPAPEPDFAPPAAEVVDPYAEAKRSKAILEAQEGAPPPAEPARATGAATAGGPVRVMDGDTFVHAGTRIRVADIDTPEVRGRCPYETALAAKATARMRQLLAQGDFQLHPLPNGRDEDRYGRKLRIVTRDGRSIGDELVAEGLARTRTGRREPWCS
jgi:endonuclease YncB( thermonuclease family)